MRTVAIVPVDANVPIAAFVRRLVDALAVHGATRHLDAREVDRELGRDGIAGCAESDAAAVRLVEWLNEQELRHRFVVYETAPGSRWTERAVRQADHVLFVAEAGGAHDALEIERYLAGRAPGSQAPRASIVFSVRCAPRCR